MSEWISVDDRLPPEETPVLIFSDYFYPVPACLVYDENGKPLYYVVSNGLGTGYRFDLDTPTHWMPLPQCETYQELKKMNEEDKVRRINE